ncbi:MAG: hypothetical protein R3C05_13965 [Pirellulaceae bacterium]
MLFLPFFWLSNVLLFGADADEAKSVSFDDGRIRLTVTASKTVVPVGGCVEFRVDRETLTSDDLFFAVIQNDGVSIRLQHPDGAVYRLPGTVGDIVFGFESRDNTTLKTYEQCFQRRSVLQNQWEREPGGGHPVSFRVPGTYVLNYIERLRRKIN